MTDEFIGWLARTGYYDRGYGAPPRTRRCRACGQVKPLREFVPRTHGGGYAYHCRECDPLMEDRKRALDAASARARAIVQRVVNECEQLPLEIGP